VDAGSANPTFGTLFADHHLDVPVATAGDHFTVRTDADFENAQLATMDIFTDHAGTGYAAVTHAVFTTL
jgi:hypothetical protein